MSEDRSRFHPNKPSDLHHITSPRTYLKESLTHILKNAPPSNPWTVSASNTSLFKGPTSIAYLFLHLSYSHPNLSVLDKKPAEWCVAYSDCGQASTPLDTSRGCGITNEYLSYRAVLAASTSKTSPTTSSTAISELLTAVSSISTPPQFNEWFQGRSGTLALLRIVRHFCPSYASDINAAIESLITHILSQTKWTHFDHHLFGAGHGDIGILTQLVLSSPHPTALAPKLEHKLNGLLDRQSENGNWFNSSTNENSLVQFCHGAPGFAICLRSLRPYFPALQNRIDVAVRKAEALTWQEGILIKEPNLCHGVYGNALALSGERKELFLSVATPEKVWKGREEGVWIKGSEPFGLLWGEAGRAWIWAGLDRGWEGALGRFPGFNDV